MAEGRGSCLESQPWRVDVTLGMLPELLLLPSAIWGLGYLGGITVPLVGSHYVMS